MKLTVNGVEHETDASPDTPMLWVLRDHLGLKGTRFGCGVAQCGACTIHLDGVAIRSCVTPLSEVEGRAITTIEGIATAEGLHPVQRAFIEHAVPQCGYCQSGQIMSAVNLLRFKPVPTDADIDACMSANLCRCGTYPRIRAAIHAAAKQMQEGDTDAG